MEIGVITNPRSRKNRGRPDRAERLQSIVGNLGEVYSTESVSSIKPVLREFLRRRARYWVADGGDGALHWMLRMGMEVLEEDEFAGMRMCLPLLPTNGGTIDFVAHNVGIRGNAESILSRLRALIESGQQIEEIEVDSMLVEGVEVTDEGEVPFRTYGFACAAGGIGQRFFSKYYADHNPTPGTIVKVVGKTLASLPVAISPLRHVPAMSRTLGRYALDVFEPARARVILDGMTLPEETFGGVHIASMSINLGNVFRFFGKAEEPGVLHALLGPPSAMAIVLNLPRMTMGKEMRGKGVIDRACRTLTVEAVDDDLLAPVIDGEYYRNLRKVTFKVGPRVRIPKVVGARKNTYL